nr:D-alanyl-D-alanine carboxypeptidase family protein [Acididesulfobacillus acetoxydans]
MANLGSPVSAQTMKAVPPIQGEAVYLMDLQSGQVLYAKNPEEKLNPASTTKIMTALLAIERGNLNDRVTASRTMLDSKIVYGTQIYLKPGERMSLKDLLYAVLLNSANDAAVAVAEHIGGNLPHFVDLMNKKAKEIGMVNTHFMNPTGLTEKGHFTTARDLALLARVAYQNPVFRQYVKTKIHTIPRAQTNVPTVMVNENKLLWQDPDVNGMKTGYTTAAENCLVATATRGGRELVGVILKAPGGELFSNMKELLNYGFSSAPTLNRQQASSVLPSTDKPELKRVHLRNVLVRAEALKGVDLGVIDFLYFSPLGVLSLLAFYLLVHLLTGLGTHRRAWAKSDHWEEN